MGWNDGEDVSTGQLITAARWNNYLGDSGSIEWLKSALETLSQSDVTGSRAIDGTVYQNTSGKRLFCYISIRGSTTNGGSYDAFSDENSPPTQVVADTYLGVAGPDYSAVLAFFVQIGHYYKVVSQPNSILDRWIETTLG